MPIIRIGHITFLVFFLGIDHSQYEATKEFTNKAKKAAGNSEDLKTFALGHSLANNNQVMVQLIDGEYDEVYGVNGAQVNIDQLLETDESLYRYVIRKFSYKYEDID